MKHGFIKVAAATPDILVADCEYNSTKIIELIEKANESKVKLIVFPELCITGYTCADLFLQNSLLDSAKNSLHTIKNACENIDMVVVVGLPLSVDQKLYNCGAVIYKGEILGIVPKTNIPNYGEFSEKRVFSEAGKTNTKIPLFDKQVYFGTNLIFKHQKINEFAFAVEICEDLWVPNPPSIKHAINGATIILNLSASSELVSKSNYRRSLVEMQSAKLSSGYIHADAGCGESTTDLVFSGHNIIAENGKVICESKQFSNEMIISEIDVLKLDFERRRLNTFPDKTQSYETIYFDMPIEETNLSLKLNCHPFVPDDPTKKDMHCKEILNLQAYGLKKRLEHTKAQTIVIGVSGGMDSCLALLACVKAVDILKMPRTSVLAVTMPCFGTTNRTRTNAELLCESLGVTFKAVDITNTVTNHLNDINHDLNDFSIVYENAQARMRTLTLMNIANQTNGIVIGTGDLSELALGWATYNGDHMSMYAVNSTVPKTLIPHIIKFYADSCENENLTNVLYDILNTPVSPELLPSENGEISHFTQDVVGPYELHDFFLFNVIRWGFSPSKVFRLSVYVFDNYDKNEILKWLKVFYERFFSQQFKRSCLPDGPKVGSVCLSPRGDHRMPSDAVAGGWLKELEQIKL